MLSVSPVSSVNFRSSQIDLAAPGKYSNPVSSDQVSVVDGSPKKKSRKFLKTVLGLAAAAAVLVALPKLFPKAIKVLSAEEKEGAKFMQKVAHYLASAGEVMGKYTYEPIANLFKKAHKE